MTRRLAKKIAASAQKLGRDASVLEVQDGASGKITTAVRLANDVPLDLFLVGVTKNYAEYLKIRGSLRRSDPVVVENRDQVFYY
jgi:hypothetical protein